MDGVKMGWIQKFSKRRPSQGLGDFVPQKLKQSVKLAYKF